MRTIKYLIRESENFGSVKIEKWAIIRIELLAQNICKEVCINSVTRVLYNNKNANE